MYKLEIQQLISPAYICLWLKINRYKFLAPKIIFIMNNDLEIRMENIKSIFQDAKNISEKENDIKELNNYLENTNSEFRAVAYEGASMALALKDFSDAITMKRWNALLGISQNYTGNIHIGFGWAIAEAKPKDLSFINAIQAMNQFRVWDGCGYYDGIFRQRNTIKNQTRQGYITEINFKAYDEGIGRSLWYSCKGNVAKVAEIIKGFSSSRQPDLWRGIGIACSFVGGCEEIILKTLSTQAEKHFVQLSIGSAMVAKTRIHANCITKDSELACNVWCNLSAEKASQIINKCDSSCNESLIEWLSLMESEISYIQ